MKTKNKFSEQLEKQIQSNTSEPDMLDIIIELDSKSETISKQNSSASRQEQIIERKESFARISAPVEDIVNQFGGKVLEKVWLNRTLHAKLPVSALKAVSELDEVEILDSSNELEPESKD